MAGFGSVIVNRLTADSAINAAIGGNVLPQFRDDLVPSIVYDSTVFDTAERYDGNDPTHYEVVLSVIGETYQKAAEIADLVRDYLNYTNWTDSPHVVMGTFYKDRDESTVEGATKKKRLAVVELRFDMIVKQSN